MKRIGILGSGIVGKTLANGFIKNGCEVMIGSRDPSKLDDWESTSGGQTGTFEEAASYGDLLILAVKGSAAEQALEMALEKNLKDKTIIDTTNPIDPAPPEDGVLKFFTSLDDSLMERLQKRYEAARFVKAFNSVGSAFMIDPDFNGQKPTMFICGNSTEAKSEVIKILKEFGWDIEDMGSAKAARAIEPLCMLWCIPGFLENRWTHAFRLLRK